MLVNLNRSSIFFSKCLYYKVVLKSGKKAKERLLPISFGLLRTTGMNLVKNVKMSY